MFAWLMGLRTIAPDGVRRLAHDPQASVIDVNARERWMAAHVPGARNLDPVTYEDSDLPDDKDAALVFYCSGVMCRKAPIAARRAEKMGYRNVRVMSAGINGWLAAKMPTEAGG